MEALSALGIDWKLLLAQGVNFLVLLYILKRFAYKPMLDHLEQRTARIERGLRDAEAAKIRLEEAAAKEEAILGKAREAAKQIVADAEIAAEKRGEKIVAEVEKKAASLLEEAKKHAEQERDSLFREAKNEIAGLVLAATEKVLQEKLAGSTDEELAKRFLEK
jgi:F-type H+-transporting ATPase subunit b